MPDINQIEALIARVEAATGPDREIDCAVHWLVKPILRGLGSFEDWMGTDSSKSITPPYTSSLDAIVGLIERELPGAMRASGCMEEGPFCRIVFPDASGSYAGNYVEAFAQTEALSCCLAFLRAPCTPRSSYD